MAKRFSICNVLSIAFVLLAWSAAVHAQPVVPTATTRPDSPLMVGSQAVNSLEQRTVGFSSTSPTTTALSTDAPAHSIGFDLSRMAIALAIVLGLIFGARWLVMHLFVGARAPSASKAVKVLGRTSLAPRQQVLLLQVGRRVVVVGESNGQLATLAQVDDPDEVAALIGQLHEEQARKTTSFSGLFGRVQKRFSPEEDEHSTRDLSDLEGPMHEPSLEPATDVQAKSELSGLIDKVRSIRDQMGRQ